MQNLFGLGNQSGFIFIFLSCDFVCRCVNRVKTLNNGIINCVILKF